MGRPKLIDSYKVPSFHIRYRVTISHWLLQSSNIIHVGVPNYNVPTSIPYKVWGTIGHWQFQNYKDHAIFKSYCTCGGPCYKFPTFHIRYGGPWESLTVPKLHLRYGDHKSLTVTRFPHWNHILHVKGSCCKVPTFHIMFWGTISHWVTWFPHSI